MTSSSLTLPFDFNYNGSYSICIIETNALLFCNRTGSAGSVRFFPKFDNMLKSSTIRSFSTFTFTKPLDSSVQNGFSIQLFGRENYYLVNLNGNSLRFTTTNVASTDDFFNKRATFIVVPTITASSDGATKYYIALASSPTQVITAIGQTAGLIPINLIDAPKIKVIKGSAKQEDLGRRNFQFENKYDDISIEDNEARRTPRGDLITRWSDDVHAQKMPHSYYPRPILIRNKIDWTCLNGLWKYTIVKMPRGHSSDPEQRYKLAQQNKIKSLCTKIPTIEQYDGDIIVPYPLESKLSHVNKYLHPRKYLFYHKSFKKPEVVNNKRTLMHFGACDWESIVYINKEIVGIHQGGYSPFTIDITNALKHVRKNSVVQLDIQVFDSTDLGSQPRGKQTVMESNIWYTAVTGLWQSVWLEHSIPESYIKSIKCTSGKNLNDNGLKLYVQMNNNVNEAKQSVKVTMMSGIANEVQDYFPCATNNYNTYNDGIIPKILVQYESSSSIRNNHMHFINTTTNMIEIAIDLNDVQDKLVQWNSTTPHLYSIKVEIGDDECYTYHGFRSVEVVNGRIKLNNKNIFLNGLLDQGWWPDGLYTAPTFNALVYDIDMTKKLGFNTIRKHVKTEPSIYYTYCDINGIYIMQDMPNAAGHVEWKPGMPTNDETNYDNLDLNFVTKNAKDIFKNELIELIYTLRFHPCILSWVPLNEGWSQHDTKYLTHLVKQLDSNERIINSASGGNDFYYTGDFVDTHTYPEPPQNALTTQPLVNAKFGNRAKFIGEWGGFQIPNVVEHSWDKLASEQGWGYAKLKSKEELTKKYVTAINGMMSELAKGGLCGCIYTQTTDVEEEINGLMTYDRILKVDFKEVFDANENINLMVERLEDDAISTRSKM